MNKLLLAFFLLIVASKGLAATPEIPLIEIKDYKYFMFNTARGPNIRFDSVSIWGGEMFVASAPYGLFVLNPETGKVLRRKTYSAFYEPMSIYVSRDFAYVGVVSHAPGVRNYIALIDRVTLNEIQRFPMAQNNFYPEGLFVDEHRIAYVTSGAERVFVMDLNSGKALPDIVMSVDENTFHRGLGPPTLAGRDLFFSHWGIVKLNLDSERFTEFPRTRIRLPNGQTAGLPEFPGQMAIRDHLIFVTDDFRGIGVLAEGTGEIRAYIPAKFNGSQQPFRSRLIQIVGNRVYAIDNLAYTVFDIPQL